MAAVRYSLCALLLLGAAPAFAEEAPGDDPSTVRAALEIGLEYFRWQEYDDAGLRLLTEHGPRLIATATLDNLARADSGFLFALHLAGYTGEVDYDGQDSGRRFVATLTEYEGWDLALDGGWRLADLVSGAAALDLFAGVGVEQWRRDILGGINALGLPVQGLVEDYTVGYVRAGIGITHNHSPPQGRLTLGFRRPLVIDEDVNLGGERLRLHPGERVSSFVDYKVSLLPTAGGGPFGLYMRVWYENYRFSKSDPVSIDNLLVWQPRSHLDVFGIAFGYTF